MIIKGRILIWFLSIAWRYTLGAFLAAIFIRGFDSVFETNFEQNIIVVLAVVVFVVFLVFKFTWKKQTD